MNISEATKKSYGLLDSCFQNWIKIIKFLLKFGRNRDWFLTAFSTPCSTRYESTVGVSSDSKPLSGKCRGEGGGGGLITMVLHS